MELAEVYKQMQGDYEDVISRLVKDERVIKHLLKFRNQSFMENVKAALAKEDYEAAFMEMHNLKGLCANLGITRLGSSTGVLTDALRKGKPSVDITDMVAEVEKDYALTLAAIAQLDQ